MRIEDLTPTPDPGFGHRTIARFAIRLTPDVKLVGFRLRQREDGGFRVVPPTIGGNASAHFAPALFQSITHAATAAYEGLHANDRARA